MRRSSFTLIELLLVVGIIGILAAIVITAINPSRQLAQARNAQRRGAVNVILNAINQFSLDSSGNLPTGIDTTLRMIGTASSGCAVSCGRGGTGSTAAACLNLTSALVPLYMPQIPTDPSVGSTERTYYAVRESGTGRLLVRACGAELGEVIDVER